MSPAEVDRVLASHGIHYEVCDDVFYDGRRPLEFGQVLALLNGVSGDELASYLDAKCDAARLVQRHSSKLPMCHCIDYE